MPNKINKTIHSVLHPIPQTLTDFLHPNLSGLVDRICFIDSNFIIKTFLTLVLDFGKCYLQYFTSVVEGVVSHALMQSIASSKLSVCLTCAVMKPWVFKSRLYSVALLCFPSLMLRAWSSPRLGPLLSSSKKISLSRSPQPGSMVQVHDVYTDIQL